MLIYSFVSRVASIFNGIVYFCSFSHRFIDFTVSAVFIASLNKILRNVLKRQETLEYRAMTQYRWEIPISNKNHILRLEAPWMCFCIEKMCTESRMFYCWCPVSEGSEVGFVALDFPHTAWCCQFVQGLVAITLALGQKYVIGQRWRHLY